MLETVPRPPDEGRNSALTPERSAYYAPRGVLTPEEERQLAMDAQRDVERAHERSETSFELSVEAGNHRPRDRAWAVPYCALKNAGRSFAAGAFVARYIRQRHRWYAAPRIARRRCRAPRRRTVATASRPSSTGDPESESDGRHPRSHRRIGGAA